MRYGNRLPQPQLQPVSIAATALAPPPQVPGQLPKAVSLSAGDEVFLDLLLAVGVPNHRRLFA